MTPQALMRGTRSSVMGKIIAVAAGQEKKSWASLTPRHRQRAQGRPQTSIFLNIRILPLGVFRWTNPVSNGRQPHSQTKRGG